MSKKLLLVSTQPDDASFVAEISQAMGAKLEVAGNSKEAVEILNAEDLTAIFYNVDNLKDLQQFELDAQRQFGLFSEKIHPNRFHYLSKKPLHENRDVTQSPFFSSYFEIPTEEVIENAELYARFVKASEQMSTHELKYFLQERGKIQTLQLTHTDQKQEAAEAVRQYLIQAKVPGRIANVIANSVDELLMNAMFDAPTDDFGNHIYSSTSRNQSRELVGKEVVKMSIGFDGFSVGVSVTDSFGSLDRSRIVNHVSMSYRDRDYTVKHGQPGAGLGLAAILYSGGSLIYHCENRTRTEATLLYRAYPSFREFKHQFRFFSAKFYV